MHFQLQILKNGVPIHTVTDAAKLATAVKAMLRSKKLTSAERKQLQEILADQAKNK